MATPDQHDRRCVAVVIPVYNAEDYLREAVASALSRPQVAEVLLIDDGSQDGSLALCEACAREDARVVVLRHDDGGNCGPAAARNVGIRAGTADYVAFLDADDYYLDGRFDAAVGLLNDDPALDGVYEPVEARFQSEQAETQWAQRGLSRVTMMTRRVAPEDLLATLLTGTDGHIHLDGLLVRQAALVRAGLFDEAMTFGEDTAVILKLAALSRLAPGRTTEGAVAVRRVHTESATMGPSYHWRRERRHRMWRGLYAWAAKADLSADQRRMIADAFLRDAERGDGRSGLWARMRCLAASTAAVVFSDPGAMFHAFFWRRVLRIGRAN